MKNKHITNFKNVGLLFLSFVLLGCSDINNKGRESETKDLEMELLYPTEVDKSLIYLNSDYSTEERVADLLARMSLEEKAAQMVQGEINHASGKDVQKYGLGSILSGGNSNPEDNTLEGWNNMIKGYQVGAFSRTLKIPIIYGVDAVHGHSNVYGATIFPHNIGLGAANNDSLMYEMGKITAQEVLATGINWNFAPCVALAMDPRWGRTYESFSTDVNIVTNLAGAYTKGLMSTSLVATAKHYVGDGGTLMGSGRDDKSDRGNTVISEEELESKLLLPYRKQIELGVQTVMPSYSSLNGLKMHQNSDLINNVLKGEMNFNGFTISDWQGIEEIPNATFEEQVWISINAGMDMLMQPEKWKATIEAIVKGVNEGNILESRINDAVSRILKVKFDSGLFEDPLLIKNENRADNLRNEKATNVATQLVEGSLVLLQNKGSILPFKENTSVFVTGEGVTNIGLQCGGWTIDWQGGVDSTQRITTGVSTLEALQAYAITKNIEIITDKNMAREADFVLMVLAEKPYAEWFGDSEDLSVTGTHAHEGNRETIKFVSSLNKPTVTVLFAGRHLVDLDKYLDNWDGIVMAYLPGSEGGQGIANVLVGESNFVGKLAMPWYKDLKDIRKEEPDLLYEIGYGLSH